MEVYDPWADKQEVKDEYNIDIICAKPDLSLFDVIILTVGHNEFYELEVATNSTKVVYDVKGVLNINNIDSRL